MHRGGLVPHALTDREAPAAAGDPLSEAVSDGELPHISAHGAGRPEPQRHAHRAAQTGRLVRVPGPAIVEEGRHPDYGGARGSGEHTPEIPSPTKNPSRLLLLKKKK